MNLQKVYKRILVLQKVIFVFLLLHDGHEYAIRLFLLYVFLLIVLYALFRLHRLEHHKIYLPEIHDG